MDRVAALKRSKRKCCKQELKNELDDSRKPVNDKHDEEKQGNNSQDTPVKKKHLLEIQVKVEGQKAGTSKPVNNKDDEEKQGNNSQDTPVKKKHLLEIQVKVEGEKKAGTSKLVNNKDDEEKQGDGSQDRPVKKHRLLEIFVKVEGEKKAGTSKKAKIQTKRELPEAILEADTSSPRPENEETLAFRKDVFEVLREPFNRDEYKNLYKQFIDGSYDVHYEGVKKKMHRLRQEKRWMILRGFFFWLQNAPRKGAFQPWTDRACLDFEPES